jgi:hypothetical protein
MNFKIIALFPMFEFGGHASNCDCIMCSTGDTFAKLPIIDYK